MTHAPGPVSRPRRPGLLAALMTIAAIIALGVAVVVGVRFLQASGAHPSPDMTLAVIDGTKASDAAAAAGSGSPEAAAAGHLAGQPTAVWLTPEEHPLGQVGTQVTDLLAEAAAQDAVLTLVVYGLPERDCGSFSAGGLAEADYHAWVTEIGDALRAAEHVRSIVIIEPDSLTLAPKCGNTAERVPQLQAAVHSLSAPNAWLYLDGGHSDWLPAPQMADLIRQVDRGEDIRGFATNVSNYNDLASEFAYARELSSLLDGMHAVVDSGRSGAGSTGEWCNPPDRLIGAPAGTVGDDVVDVNLWIKPPGESDGTCNGGPPAGEWWPQAAVELTREVRR